jgi:phosphoribosylaminoimidazole-succinocarboxamide synthase
MQKREQIYSGKAKTLFATDIADKIILHFRDDATAFNGVKKAALANKGKVNNYFNAFIMQHLAQAEVPTHFEQLLTAQESVVKNLQMIPIECVIRNIAAGSISQRLGIPEGTELKLPIFEFFWKNDALNDPFINEYHALSLNLATAEELIQVKNLTFQVNTLLKALFAKADMLLVDFKLEFGRFHHQVLLGDEFTPDGCRIWDNHTHEKLDKDRFRRDMGNVIESYQIVAERLGIKIPCS